MTCLEMRVDRNDCECVEAVRCSFTETVINKLM